MACLLAIHLRALFHHTYDDLATVDRWFLHFPHRFDWAKHKSTFDRLQALWRCVHHRKTCPGPDGMPFDVYRELAPLVCGRFAATGDALGMDVFSECPPYGLPFLPPDAVLDSAVQAPYQYRQQYSDTDVYCQGKTATAVTPEGVPAYLPHQTCPLQVSQARKRIGVDLECDVYKEAFQSLVPPHQAAWLQRRTGAKNALQLQFALKFWSSQQGYDAIGHLIDLEQCYPQAKRAATLKLQALLGFPPRFLNFQRHAYRGAHGPRMFLILKGRVYFIGAMSDGLEQGGRTSAYTLPLTLGLLIQQFFARVRSRQLHCLLWAFADDIAFVTGVKILRTSEVPVAKPLFLPGAAFLENSGLPRDEHSPGIKVSGEKSLTANVPRRLAQGLRRPAQETKRFEVFILFVLLVREAGPALGFYIGFLKTVCIFREPALREIERLAVLRANIPLSFKIQDFAKYLGFWVAVDPKRQQDIVYEHPIENLRKRVFSTRTKGRKHAIATWNVKCIPPLSWVAQVAIPNRKQAGEVGYFMSYHCQFRGDMAVGRLTMGQQKFIYGAPGAPLGFQDCSLSIRNRVSLLFASDEVDYFVDQTDEWPQEEQRATWVRSLLEAREHLVRVVEIPFNILLSNMRQRRRLFLLKQWAAQGFLDIFPGEYIFYVDGGGRDTKQTEWRLVQGASAWSLDIPSGKTCAEGGQPWYPISYSPRAEVAHAWPGEVDCEEWNLISPWCAVEVNSSSSELLAVVLAIWFLVDHQNDACLAPLFQRGIIRFVLDSQNGPEAAKGMRLAWKEPGVGLLLRRLGYWCSQRGLQVLLFWQKSNVKGNRKGYGVSGNDRADSLVDVLRRTQTAFRSFGSLPLDQVGPEADVPILPDFLALEYDEADTSGESERVLAELFSEATVRDAGRDVWMKWLEGEAVMVSAPQGGPGTFLRRKFTREHSVLRYAQRYFSLLLRGCAWLDRRGWGQATEKVQKEWLHLDAQLWEIRLSFSYLHGVSPRVFYSKLDLCHNAWLTGARRPRTEPPWDARIQGMWPTEREDKYQAWI